MTGRYLPQRVKNIIDGVRAPGISRVRMTFVVLACAIPAVVFAAGTLDHVPQLLPLPLPAISAPPPVLLAQAPAAVPSRALEAPKLEFEVATVRVAEPRTANAGPAGGGRILNGGPGTDDPERMTYTGVPMMTLLIRAFGVKADQISGPDWLASERYEIAAKIPPGATKEQVNEMLKNLLIERFKFTFHLQKKEFEVYELTVAKGGPKLTPADETATPPDPGAPGGRPPLDAQGFVEMRPGSTGGVTRNEGGVTRMSVKNSSVTSVLMPLQQSLGNIHIVDKTGLTGKYDYKVAYAVLPGRAGRGGPALPAAGPTDGGAIDNASDPAPDLLTAIEKTLGLKVQKTKAPLDVVVIDRIEKIPTENCYEDGEPAGICHKKRNLPYSPL